MKLFHQEISFDAWLFVIYVCSVVKLRCAAKVGEINVSSGCSAETNENDDASENGHSAEEGPAEGN